MSPDMQGYGQKPEVPNNIYTVILAVALGVVLITTIIVAYMCYSQYGTIFKIP